MTHSYPFVDAGAGRPAPCSGPARALDDDLVGPPGVVGPLAYCHRRQMAVVPSSYTERGCRQCMAADPAVRRVYGGRCACAAANLYPLEPGLPADPLQVLSIVDAAIARAELLGTLHPIQRLIETHPDFTPLRYRVLLGLMRGIDLRHPELDTPAEARRRAWADQLADEWGSPDWRRLLPLWNRARWDQLEAQP